MTEADNILREINRKFGKQVVFTADDDKFKLTKIPTGIIPLDIMLKGGFPLGRWIEVYGDHSGLKTTMALKALANAQQLGFPGVYIDIERNITKDFMRFRGVDTNKDMLHVVRADNGEDAIDIIQVYLMNGLHKVIIIDSIAALLPKRTAENSATKESMGLEGKLTSLMTRKLTSLNQGAAIIAVNQTRDAIGTFFGGTPKVTPGGRALGFYSAQRVEVINGKSIKKEINGRKRTVGRVLHFVLRKDKTGAQQESSCEVYYDYATRDIDYSQTLLPLGIQAGVIKKIGSKYSVAGKTFVGEKRIVDFLRNKKPYRVISNLVIGKLTNE